ncbi:hypothetical protein [Nocardioides solisilvae]|uniref:hypothetical protein n=1 Tax=Nocardioides solisilvae TaxID=1542435 RepID=UPI000D750D1E|nr:hypothetical protein [Nocardioides solisilvae]
MTLTGEQGSALERRWRLRLAVSAGVLALMAAVATATAFTDEGAPPLVPALLWAAAGCLVVARRAVPPGARYGPGLLRSGAWVLLALVLVVAPVLLDRLG